MIKSFKDKKAELLYNGERVKKFQDFARQEQKRLRILDADDTFESLIYLPSNRFKTLTGKRRGPYSIRINYQWRICFEWANDGPTNVKIIDYH